MALLKMVRNLFLEFGPLTAEPPSADVTVQELECNVVEYQGLAKRAGFLAGQSLMRRERFKRFMAENGVTVYNTAKVAEYLHSICPRGHNVVWLPVNNDYGHRLGMNRSGAIWANSARGVFGVYSKPLPIPVLYTMCKFTESKGEFNDVTFYASDFALPDGDPFLAVLMGDEISADEFFVIERWDEPGFRG